MSEKKKTILLAVCAAVAVIAVAAIALLPRLAAPAAAQGGEKSVTLYAVFEDGSQKSYAFTTNEEFLGPALREQNLIGGDTSTYGFYITSVDGVEADPAKEQWWSLTKDGEMTPQGVDETPIADGDEFSLVLMAGFEEQAA